MNNPIHRPAVAALLSAATLLTGCQSYQSKPLDLAAHDEAWRLRSIEDEPVRAFAVRLAEAEPSVVFDTADGLSVSEAEIVALVYNPGLRRARLSAGVAAATAEHAGLWQYPQLTVDFLTVTESVSNPFLITPGLAFTIPISGRLEAEKERADVAFRAALTRVAEQEWATRISVREAWIRWSSSRLKADATQGLLSAIEQLVRSTQRLADAGEMRSTESALFAIEQAQLRRALRQYQGISAAAEQEIRTLMGVSPGAPLELIPSLDPSTDGDMSAESLASTNLTLARLRDEYEVAERTLYREIREQYPDLTIGPLAEFDRGDTLLGVSVSLPIPILNANKQGIAQADAQREAARAAFETEYETLIGRIEAASVRLDSLRGQRELLEAEIVPLTDRQLADARRLIGLGESSGLVLLESISRVGEAQIMLVDTRAAEALAEVELASLIGPPSTITSSIDEPEHNTATTDIVAGEHTSEVSP